MDVSAFLQLLLQELSSDGQDTCPHLIRFQERHLYEQCREGLRITSLDEPLLAQVRDEPLLTGFRCMLPTQSQEKWASYERELFVEEDIRINMHAASHKPVSWERGIPWGVRQVKAPQAWSSTTGHRVLIGVIDTGADYKHPDLRHSLLSGINLVHRGLPPRDDNGHGTHIAGTIAASNQMYGIIGIAPRALIHPVKAFDINGSAYVSDIVAGIDWCVRNKVQVINMSFGMKSRSKSLLQSVTNAYNAGVTIVASSGNDSKRKSIDYPARYSQTISVGATDRNRHIAPFSNRGSFVDIYAPGEKIVSAWLKGKYHEMSGTSMATSHVSGAIALLLAIKPGLKPNEIKVLLKRTANPTRSRTNRQNALRIAGEIDIARLLREANV
ncbi:S8 family peptidase [Paenibacillus sp. ACRRX]|uniref:S8 family peptidase n=1 Tax=unclassified Paenibacillus TaxID=185978 RepID=UPI001EF55497|nr:MULTISPECIES: S8 family peptidase [unclassified Paenibacillus]MCG7410722.1 S8 family peptidase [Paenibacillus sp. ACRRX]MDK8184015.1 S8 family peptidase [Paenibacillus sp. UMB4589-SE434]